MRYVRTHCVFDGCDRPLDNHGARGLCAKHYARERNAGNLDRYTRITREQQFRAMTEDVGGCWMWKGHVAKSGYGLTSMGDRTVSAHRAAYELFVGPIPDELEIDHLCARPTCVNP